MFTGGLNGYRQNDDSGVTFISPSPDTPCARSIQVFVPLLHRPQECLGARSRRPCVHGCAIDGSQHDWATGRPVPARARPSGSTSARGPFFTAGTFNWISLGLREAGWSSMPVGLVDARRSCLDTLANNLQTITVPRFVPPRFDPPRHAGIGPRTNKRACLCAVATRRFAFHNDIEWRRFGPMSLDIRFHFTDLGQCWYAPTTVCVDDGWH